MVVTLNHRLNVFGFLNFTKFGGKYQQSVNVGMLDLVVGSNGCGTTSQYSAATRCLLHRRG